ncbi:MAG: pyridoxal-phosphate dependent enzyme, partial [Candidatus Bathyarchaeota archaeon]
MEEGISMRLSDIYAARRRMGHLVRETPLVRSPFLSGLCGGEVWLKLENLQINGSFKVRGALSKILG